MIRQALSMLDGLARLRVEMRGNPYDTTDYAALYKQVADGVEKYLALVREIEAAFEQLSGNCQ